MRTVTTHCLLAVLTAALWAGCVESGEGDGTNTATATATATGTALEVPSVNGIAPAPSAPRRAAWKPEPVTLDEFNDQARANDQPRVGGSLRIRFASEPKTLSTLIDNSAVTQYLLNYLQDAMLLQDNETLEWRPALAERWTEEDSLLEITGREELKGTIEWRESAQRWVHQGEGEPQEYRQWLVVPDGDRFFLRQTRAHYGRAADAGTEWQLTQPDGVKTFPKEQVAQVNRNTVFTFYLRRDVKWHDGQPFSGADVKFTLDTIKCEFVEAGSLRNYYLAVEDYALLDASTFRMVYAEQYYKAIEFTSFGIIPKHIYDPDDLLQRNPKEFGERFNNHPQHRQPIGTGAYRYDKWEPGQYVALKRTGTYYDPKRAGYLDELRFKFTSDNVVALQMLKGDEIDFLPGMPAEKFDEQKALPDFTAKYALPVYYTGNFGYVGWNMAKPPFDDLKVRLAMAYGAFDAEDFRKTVMKGYGVRVTGSQYYFGPAYDSSVQPYPYDPAKARKLLREAGWWDRDNDGVCDKDGRPFEFTLLMPTSEPSSTAHRMADTMIKNLKELGVTMKKSQMEWATFLDTIDARNFDACRLGWATPPESDPFQIWHSSQTGKGQDNYVTFVNAESDTLILKARTELDDVTRWRYYTRIHRIQHEEQPYMFLYCTPDLGAYHKRYRGVKMYKIRPGWDLSEWYLAAEEPAAGGG